MSKERVEELLVQTQYDKDLFDIRTRNLLKLKQQNKRYREALEKIRTVKYDDDFNPYAYMMLEIIEWAEKALEESE